MKVNKRPNSSLSSFTSNENGIMDVCIRKLQNLQNTKQNYYQGSNFSSAKLSKKFNSVRKLLKTTTDNLFKMDSKSKRDNENSFEDQRIFWKP